MSAWARFARAFGLDFVPLTSERYDLVIRREHLHLAAVERFLDTLSEAAFRRELEGLCGYDTRETGRRIERVDGLAERGRFELPDPVKGLTLSRRAR